MIVVIGGSGFVGTRFCRRLAEANRDFLIVDKRESSDYPKNWRYGDVLDIESLLAVIPQGSTIVNLAAEHRDNVRPTTLYQQVNVTGAELVCRAAEQRDCRRIIFTSSVACYGFAPANTGENGELRPFNEYGRTKAEAEQIYRRWQGQDRSGRCLVIVRPTVIFGERNRGNVYNLLRQLAIGRFVMVGDGKNIKSMAYVENVAGFLEHSLQFRDGVHLYNYVDKPDLDMDQVVSKIRSLLGKGGGVGLRIPFFVAWLGGLFLDVIARVSGREFALSAIRVRKFCATTQFSSIVRDSGYQAPFTLEQGLERTVKYEFLEDNADKAVFFTE